ncbi:Uncharacterized WD repeat-containing protein all2124, partial [Durusdinium trenchii]
EEAARTLETDLDARGRAAREVDDADKGQDVGREEILVYNVSHVDLILGLLRDGVELGEVDGGEKVRVESLARKQVLARPRFNRFYPLSLKLKESIERHLEDLAILECSTVESGNGLIEENTGGGAECAAPERYGATEGAAGDEAHVGFALGAAGAVEEDSLKGLHLRPQDETLVSAGSHGDGAPAIVSVMFPLLSQVVELWLEMVDNEMFESVTEYGRESRKVLLLISGAGTPRNRSLDIRSNSTKGAAEIMRMFVERAFPGIEVACLDSGLGVFHYDQNVRFCHEVLLPHIEDLRRPIVNRYGNEWQKRLRVTVALTDGSPARLAALNAALRTYRPNYLHMWQLKTFWHEHKLFRGDLFFQTFETMETKPPVPFGQLDRSARMLVTEMRSYKEQFEKAREQHAIDEMSTFWLRKSRKCVLSVLMVNGPTGPRFFRGMNLEVSMPTGSLCSERNVIGTALASDPTIKRCDFVMIAVLSMTLTPPPLATSAVDSPRGAASAASLAQVDSPLSATPSSPPTSTPTRTPDTKPSGPRGAHPRSSGSRNRRPRLASGGLSTYSGGAAGPAARYHGELNPIAPCGSCNEWLKKIAEVNPTFKVVTFPNSACEEAFVREGREAVVNSAMPGGRGVHVCCAQAPRAEEGELQQREEQQLETWGKQQAALVVALRHALPDREVTCSGAGGEVDVEQVGLVVVCASQRFIDAVNGRQGEIWTHWCALVVRKQLPFVVVVVEPEASQELWTGGFALQAGRAAAVEDLFGEEKGIVEDAVAQIVQHIEPEEEDDQQESEDDVVLFALDGFDPLQVAREKSALYVEGTRAWALDEFRAWANRSASVWASDRVLVFVGPAGFGKSVLMARICDENGLLDDDDGADEASSPARKKKRRSIPLLSMLGGKKTQEQTLVKVRAAHFFKHDDKQACDLKTCLLSVANQLAAVLPAYREEITKLDKNEILHGLGPAVLFDRLIAEPMSKVPEPSERVVVFLDALDEVIEADRGVLLHIVRNLWHTKLPPWLGLVLSTRPEDPIRDTLEVFRPTVLQLDDERNLADLRHFLETRLRRHLAHVERDLQHAVEILAERAEGLFLYAYFVDQALVGRESMVASLEELEEVFPDGGIDDMYQSYFSRLLDGPLHGDQKLYGVLLGTLVAVRSPVPRDVLQAAVRMDSVGEFDEILARSEQLLAVGPEMIRFIHKSMSDFAQDRHRAGARLVVDADVGHRELARVVVDAPAFMRSSPFLLRHALFHLGQTGKADVIARWLLDFRNVHQALQHSDPIELVFDVKKEEVTEEEVLDVLRILEQAAFALRQNPDELAGQVYGRVGSSEHPFCRSVAAHWHPSKPWVKPLSRGVLAGARNPLRASLPCGKGGIKSLSFSPDGTLLVVVKKGGTVMLWDTSLGVLLSSWVSHDEEPKAFFIGERLILSMQDDEDDKCVALIWSTDSGPDAPLVKGELLACNSKARCLVVQEASKGDRGTVIVWTLPDKLQHFSVTLCDVRHSWFVVMPDVLVAKVKLDVLEEIRRVRVWHFRQSPACVEVALPIDSVIMEFTFSPKIMRCVVSPDGTRMAMFSDCLGHYGNRRGFVHVLHREEEHWDMAWVVPYEELDDSRNCPLWEDSSICFLSDSRTLMVKWDFVQVLFFDTDDAARGVTRKEVSDLSVVNTAHEVFDGSALVLRNDVETEPTVLWDVATWTPQWQLAGADCHKFESTSCVLLGVEYLLDEGRKIVLWNANGETIGRWEFVDDDETLIALSRDGATVARVYWYDTIYLYDTARFRVALPEVQRPFTNVISLSKDGLKAAVARWNDPVVYVFHVPSQELIWSLKGQQTSIESLAISFDGSVLWTPGGGGLRLWKLRKHGATESVTLGPERAQSVTKVVLSRDGEHVACGWTDASGDDFVGVWHTHRGEEVFFFNCTQKPSSLSLTARVLASGSAQGTLSLWKLNTDQVLQALQCDSEIFDVVLSEEEGSVAALSRKTVRVWQLETGCQVLVIEHSIERWAEFGHAQLKFLPHNQIAGYLWGTCFVWSIETAQEVERQAFIHQVRDSSWEFDLASHTVIQNLPGTSLTCDGFYEIVCAD